VPTPSSAKLLLHPVRLRIVQAFLGDRTRTTADLRAELDDVPAASLYRHVAILADAGVLTVASERRVRGAVERTYALRTAAAQVAPRDLAAMTPDDHRAAFTAFAASLLADVDRYLSGPDPDLLGDGVGYRQVALWLDDAEFAGLATELQQVVVRRLGNAPGGGRRLRALTTIVVPSDPPGPSRSHPDAGSGTMHA